MNIMIAQSYFRALDPKEKNQHRPYPPLGTLIIATYLQQKGHNIHFYDCMLAVSAEHIFEEIKTVNPDILLLYDDEFNFVTKMALLNMREHTFQIVDYANQLEIPSIIYTSDAIDHPDLYLEAGSDLVITGEGETVVEDILGYMEGSDLPKSHYQDIAGIAYLDNDNQMSRNERKPLRSDLDELPDPAYDEFVNMDKYREIWLEHHGYFSINVTTSRGCTYGCNWCAKPLWGRTYNSYSPRRIADLFKKLERKYQVNHIWITDDIFGLQKNWLREFAEICVKEEIQIPYKCLSRVDLLLRDNRIDHLKQSGCEIIWVGAESGSQKILDKMEKGIKVEQTYEATTKVHEAGMKIAFFLQMGYLGETWEDLQKTRNMVLDCLPDDIGISVSYPLPGTKFYDMVKDHLEEKQNWTDSSDLDMMFHGTYSREFYRNMHQLIHNEYRYKKTLKNFGIKKLPKLLYHKSLSTWYDHKVNKLREKENQQKQDTEKHSKEAVSLQMVGE